MPFTETIVCLANSRKMAGRCVAGKVYASGSFGRWVRPVSARKTEELSDKEQRLVSGDYAKLLDVVAVPLLSHTPRGCQTENCLIDTNHRWKRAGAVPWEALEDALDRPETLWLNGHRSAGGVNDRIPADKADTLTNSLLLIKPESLRVEILVDELNFGKRRLRAMFEYHGQPYKFWVTDLAFEQACRSRPVGEFAVERAYLCVSIGEPYEGHRYKLAASIITPETPRP